MLGLLLGLAVFWRHGWAFVLDGALEGYHWDDYLEAGWMIVHRIDLGYPTFRQPLYGSLVGHVGEWMGSYANAGILLSSGAAVMLLLGAAAGGRALGGPWAGGIAAFLVPTVQVTLSAPRWSNLYAVLAGTSGLSLGLAALVARWPHPLTALLAGILGGVAWGVDSRGLAMVPAAALLVGLGALRSQSKLRGLLLLACFLLPLKLGPLSQDRLQIPGVGRPQPVQQLRFQRRVFLRWATMGHADQRMHLACRGQDEQALPSPATLRSDCAQAMAEFNFGTSIPRQLPLPVGWTLMGAGLCLLPRRRRGLADSLPPLLLLGGGLAPLIAFSWWIPYPDRYLVQFAVPLCLLAPVGSARLLSWVGPKRAQPWVMALGMSALGAFAWIADPTQRLKPTTEEESPWEKLRAEVGDAVATRMDPDDGLLDCANLHTGSRWLPRVTSQPPMMALDDRRCIAWIQDPPRSGTAWLLLSSRQPLRNADGSPFQTLPEGWVLDWEKGDVRLLRFEAP